MMRFRQRCHVGSIVALLVVGLLGFQVATWRFLVADAPSRLSGLDVFGSVFFLALAAFIYTVWVRPSHREVRVDDRGLWVAGTRVVRPEEIELVSVDVFNGAYGIVDRLHKTILHPVAGPVIVSRERDVARTGDTPTVLVVTTEWIGSADGPREGWLIGSYRPRELWKALRAIAPHAADPQLDDDGRLLVSVESAGEGDVEGLEGARDL